MPTVDLRPFMNAVFESLEKHLGSKLTYVDFQETAAQITADITDNLWRAGITVRRENDPNMD